MNSDIFLTDKKIIFFGHHKAASTWFLKFFYYFCKVYNKKISEIKSEDLVDINSNESDILLNLNSSHVPPINNNYLGIHLIRDPRDIVVSGYFYHKWCDEEWVKIYNRYYGMSYQEKLNSISKEDGINYEIDSASFTLKNISNWDYNNPFILEIKYENLIVDIETNFKKIFNHLNLNEKYYSECLDLFYKKSIFNQKRELGQITEKTHLRSGSINQWKEHFSVDHKEYFKSKHGDALLKLGYENDKNW